MEPELISKIGEVSFPGLSNLVASDKFVIDISDDAAVKISYLGKNFPIWFTSKVESTIAPSTIEYYDLVKGANNIEIIGALGGADKAETSLSEMYYLMSLQPNGKEGALLHKGNNIAHDGQNVNFFFIRDISGQFCTIRLVWQDGGWGIHAISFRDPLVLPIWSPGSRLFTRVGL